MKIACATGRLLAQQAPTAKRIFNAPDASVREVMDVGYINTMIDLHVSRRENFRRHIFGLLCYELWHRIIVRRESPGNLESLFETRD